MDGTTAGILMLAIIIGGITIEHVVDAWRDRGIAQAKAKAEIERIKAQASAGEDDAR